MAFGSKGETRRGEEVSGELDVARTILTSGPEDPAAKAERTAKARAERRARQNMRNLVWSLLASLGLVALLIIVVVRPDTNLVETVDWEEVAEQSESDLPGDPVVPMLSDLWSSNRAEVTSEPGSEATWSIGLIGPEDSYVFVDQGFGASESWVAVRTENFPSTGTIDFGYSGPNILTWVEYDRRDVDSGGNNAYVVVYDAGESIIVVGGTDARGVAEVANDLTWQLTQEKLK